MKKTIVFVILTLLLLVGAFFAYDKHFKYYLGKEYKNEINLLLEKEIPKSIKEMDGLLEEIENEKDPLEKQTIIDLGMNTILFNFYSKLIDITQKYIDIKKDIPPTGFNVELIIVLYPYLKVNNVNIEKIKSFLDYSEIKETEINKKYLKPANE